MILDLFTLWTFSFAASRLFLDKCIPHSTEVIASTLSSARNCLEVYK